VLETDAEMPDVSSMRIPVKYLANMLAAGKEEPIITALERMMAMRKYMRAQTVEGVIDHPTAEKVGLKAGQIDEMYKYMAIANYEDRFVIPTTHREDKEDAFEMRGECGFTFGNDCSGGRSEIGLFGKDKRSVAKNPMEL
jgi:nitrate reductase beta subunit